jgi:hypothetical protein
VEVCPSGYQRSNLGLLCKVLPLLTVDKIVMFFENNITLRAYAVAENLVRKMLVSHTGSVCEVDLTT